MPGLDGDPAIDYDWDTVASYLERYDRGQAINVGILVGNSALRIGAIGWEDEPADERAVGVMRSMLREAMEEGAFGISSGLDYPPGSYASTAELAGLTQEAAQHGGFYHTSGTRWATDSWIRSARRSRSGDAARGRPTSPTSITARPSGLAGRDAGAGRRRTGGRAGRHLRCLSLRMGLDQALDPAAAVGAGGWTDAPQGAPGGPAGDRIRSEMAARGAAYTSAAGWADVRLGAFSRPANMRWESHSLADVMEDTGHDAVDAMCDLLLSEDLQVAQVTTGPWTDGIRRFLPHPAAMVGTDSTFLATSRRHAYGGFPRILGQFVRDEAILSLEDAVHRMTAAPAARLGLREARPAARRVCGRRDRVRCGSRARQRHL